MPNSILNTLFDLFFAPFASMSPIWGLTAVSVLTAVIVIPVFKLTSNQEAIKTVKARIMGHILELWIYRDELRSVFSAKSRIVGHNVIYIGYMMRPLAVMLIPVVLILVHTEVRYGHQTATPGEPLVIKAVVASAASGSPVTLKAPSGVVVETPVLRTEGGRETYWRVHASERGSFPVEFTSAGETVKKTLYATGTATRLDSVSAKRGFFSSILHPGDAPIPGGSAFESIEIRYPESRVGFFFWRTNWLVVYFVLTLVFSFILLKPFKVKV